MLTPLTAISALPSTTGRHGRPSDNSGLGTLLANLLKLAGMGLQSPVRAGLLDRVSARPPGHDPIGGDRPQPPDPLSSHAVTGWPLGSEHEPPARGAAFA